MTHPITALQTALVAVLSNDPLLTGLLAGAVFDAPPDGQGPPYLVIARHDLAARNADEAEGFEHRLRLDAWAAEPSRKAALAMAERAAALALSAPLDSGGLRVTHRQHLRTESAIDPETGFARAAVMLRLFSEPSV